MLSGTLNEIRYEWPKNEKVSQENGEAMKMISEEQITLNDVNYISGKYYHNNCFYHYNFNLLSFRFTWSS